MASKYVKELMETSERLKLRGYDYSALICHKCAVRMENMEDYIVQLNKEKEEKDV
jgi:hypothetical protein